MGISINARVAELAATISPILDSRRQDSSWDFLSTTSHPALQPSHPNECFGYLGGATVIYRCRSEQPGIDRIAVGNHHLLGFGVGQRLAGINIK